jgi:hypothetical protein
MRDADRACGKATGRGLREIYAFPTDIGETGRYSSAPMETKPTPRPEPEGSQAPLPAERALVVQLRRQADLSGDLFVGRAEHIASGAALRCGFAAD